MRKCYYILPWSYTCDQSLIHKYFTSLQWWRIFLEKWVERRLVQKGVCKQRCYCDQVVQWEKRNQVSRISSWTGFIRAELLKVLPEKRCSIDLWLRCVSVQALLSFGSLESTVTSCNMKRHEDLNVWPVGYSQHICHSKYLGCFAILYCEQIIFSFPPLWTCFPDLLGILFPLLKLWIQTWGTSHHISSWTFNAVSSHSGFSCTLGCLW